MAGERGGSGRYSGLLSKNVPLLEGVLAFAVLAGLQFIIAWLAQPRRPPTPSSTRPLVCFCAIGSSTSRNAAGNQVAIRKFGPGVLRSIAAVVREADGSFSVISRDAAGERTVFPEGCAEGGKAPKCPV